MVCGEEDGDCTEVRKNFSIYICIFQWGLYFAYSSLKYTLTSSTFSYFHQPIPPPIFTRLRLILMELSPSPALPPSSPVTPHITPNFTGVAFCQWCHQIRFLKRTVSTSLHFLLFTFFANCTPFSMFGFYQCTLC